MSFVANKELSKEKTEERIRIEKLSREERNRAAFAALQGALSLIDLTQNKSVSYTTYSRESLRTYLKNPASENNQKNLRKLSNYLYTVSHVYRRLINFKAYQVQLKSWTVYPDITLVEEVDAESILQNYDSVTKYIRKIYTKYTTK